MALAVTPLITLTVSYALAAAAGHVALCVPYIEGCTSTSATGRALPGRLVFLPGMLLSAVLTAWFWLRCTTQLKKDGARTSPVVGLLGIVAALGLAVYTLSVGQSGQMFELARRWGVGVYVALVYAAMAWFVIAWRRAPARSNAGTGWLIALCVILPLWFFGGEAAKSFGLGRHPVNNVVEWNSVVLFGVYFAVVGFRLFGPSASNPGGRAASPRE